MLKSFTDQIFLCEKPFTLFGIPMRLRSTIIRDGQGRLAIHSPVEFSEDELTSIKSLGTVEQVLAPSLFHHLFLGPTREHFPNAKYLSCPGLESKKKGFSFDGTILDSKLSEDFDTVLVGGSPKINEVVIYHKPSGTLIVTDLIFNLHGISGAVNSFFSMMGGVYNKATICRLFRFHIRNKSAFSQSLDEINDLPFKHIIMSHGEPIRGEGKAAFAKVRDQVSL
ncbi:MAG: DUF4336 domain-containing protein [Pseudobacteriovorax sp.]|nr:DUF4336 domain-containing protein [Pseudobacteriovorax sp.]